MEAQLQSREEKQWINCPKFNFIKCSGTQKSLKPWFRRTESWREFVPDMRCIKPERLFFFFFFFFTCTVLTRGRKTASGPVAADLRTSGWFLTEQQIRNASLCVINQLQDFKVDSLETQTASVKTWGLDWSRVSVWVRTRAFWICYGCFIEQTSQWSFFFLYPAKGHIFWWRC